MSTFYPGAVGDTLIGAALGMVTPVETEPAPDTFKQPTYRDAIENSAQADAAYEAHRIATDIPCGCCGKCSGCYDCTPDSSEPCGCSEEAS